MQEFRNRALHGNNNGGGNGGHPENPGPGVSGAGFQGAGFHGNFSDEGFQGNNGQGSEFQGAGNNGGHNQRAGQGNQKQGGQSGFQSNPKQLNSGQYHVFTTNTCKRDQKLQRRAISIVDPTVLEYLNWSEYPVTWSWEDHPLRVDNPGSLALVVAPQVGGYKLTKVLMDGSSSINILYYDTFRQMNLSEKQLKPSSAVFHRIVPGKSAYPIGRISLEVAFVIEFNYRSEFLTFEVVRLKSAYHALFGRPA
jgi:hypothetical protein